MSDPLLTVRNHHSPGSGDPPIVNDDDPKIYIGYFENDCGEQWIFTCHRETKAARLCGGDIDWNNPVRVIGGEADGLVLSEAEQVWLHACCNAAGCR